MQIEKSKLSDNITLGLISPVLKNIKLLDMDEKSTGSSEMMFDVYTLAPDLPVQIGEMGLSSKFVQDNISLLSFHSRRRMLEGHIHEVQATVHYDNGDPLRTTSYIWIN